MQPVKKIRLGGKSLSLPAAGGADSTLWLRLAGVGLGNKRQTAEISMMNAAGAIHHGERLSITA